MPRLSFAFGPLGIDKLFSPSDLNRLAACCRIVSSEPLREFQSEGAREQLAQTDILVSGWGCPTIDQSTLEAASSLKLVAHAAGSVKHLTGTHVFERGIEVTNAAAANAIPVAEFALAAILFANKDVFRFQRLYAQQRRVLEMHQSFDGDSGSWHKRVGIVGASRIGRRVLELLRPHDMDILLYDPLVNADEAAKLGTRSVSLPELMSECQTVSLHAPLLAATKHMIDADMLARMADGATLINTARGGLVDQAALEAELSSGRLSAILDVTEPEAPAPTSPLYDLPNVLLTPHIAGAIGNERHRLGRLITDEIERFAAGKPLLHKLTLESLHHQA
ncbi:hydroxyacid dehydrogenase [Rhizobium sp. P38BS-XIX]|uniref:hydroxyacid dehydrogenase n=1 Tax=Rhizobium sp. P38BS-XIX TaxID=2726740 RepID=UPI0014563E21|nr:hydroxyacid dehydrogenase [Rhizobium sp. P38BS-XIX]NLR97595.1 hydroxyacid dehydrogenase [Rhizobium sp. P38BS-XIX]